MDLGLIMSTPGALTSGRSYKDVLLAALFLLQDESKWTQQAHARNRNGTSVRPTSPYAVCWCVLGAVAKVSNRYGIIDPQLIKYLDAFMEWKYPGRFTNFGDFNDYHTYGVVLGLVKEAVDNIPS